jgi:A/G-specific adenine glycosylase
LWTLPQAEDAASSRDWFERELHGDFGDMRALSPIDHAFSHYKLRLQPLRVDNVALRQRVGDNDDLRWVARGELAALGIPAPIRKLLES